MKNKTRRILAIKNIISTQKISSQEELLHELDKQGFNYTQATLSRDLKQLKVSKIVDSDRDYVYAFPEQAVLNDSKVQGEKMPATGFKNIEFSQNLAVIKTMPGFAPSIAFKIDSSNLYEILGTIAGDDTILLIPREGIVKSDVVEALSNIIPEIKNNI